VERIAGRVEIEHDARWRLGIGLHEHVDEPPLGVRSAHRCIISRRSPRYSA
jgi:hypothetical protein